MARHEPLIDAAIESALERCDALHDELKRVARRTFPPGASRLLKFLSSASAQIKSSINGIAADSELRNLLTASELTLRIYRYAKYFNLLHGLLGYLRGARIDDTPAALIPPLRRFVRRCAPDAEVLFTANPELNYTVIEIGSNLRRAFAGTEIEPLLADFPDAYIVISLPSVEAKNVLLHCIIAHEIGHELYKRGGLEKTLLALVKVDESKVEKVIDDAIKGLPPDGTPGAALAPSATQIRQGIRRALNETILSWLEELGCDALGLCLFGPAYYFAFVHFIVSFQHLDVTSASHPAPRLRLLLMRTMMLEGDPSNRLAFTNAFYTELRRKYDDWDHVISAQEPDHPVHKIAFAAVKQTLDAIASESMMIAKGAGLTFTAAQVASVKDLRTMLLHLIPPVERAGSSLDAFTITDLVSILNAAWQVYQTDLADLATKSDLNLKADAAAVKDRLNDIVLKTLELLEISTRWKELTNADRKRD